MPIKKKIDQSINIIITRGNKTRSNFPHREEDILHYSTDIQISSDINKKETNRFEENLSNYRFV